MKALLKVCDMRTIQDINKVKSAVANNEGVVACEISKGKKEVSVIYDDYFVDVDKIIESIENIGYTVI
ncbi:heavy-metal-associated domain-containing protein [Clostridium sporogenes]|uniref:heavy-metal-associated domain-containing protein n=1 Tax=Clostridium sporogenes TaxID=1509 RepID=UPI0029046371|nr:heavy-metal-associated domain-containing protein [Clostridium botulinum]